MTSRPMPHAERVIDEAMQHIDIIGKTAQSKKPHVIGISGGSCTGKTTYISKKILDEIGNDGVLIAQDNFQLGYGFNNYEKSKYRWDDPKNYDPQTLVHVLQELKKGKHVSVPQFDLSNNVRSRESLVITPRTFIIVEGLYTFYKELAREIDTKIYVETPYYGRFLRRVMRNTLVYGMSPDTPIKHMLGSVYWAHIDHVVKQRDTADYIVTTPYIFKETIKNFKLKRVTPVGKKIHTVPLEKQLSFIIAEANEQYFLQVEHKGKIYYEVPICAEYVKQVQQLDFQGL